MKLLTFTCFIKGQSESRNVSVQLYSNQGLAVITHNVELKGVKQIPPTVCTGLDRLLEKLHGPETHNT
jgi:hypothetical protein